jgi:hypothetical protein
VRLAAAGLPECEDGNRVAVQSGIHKFFHAANVKQLCLHRQAPVPPAGVCVVVWGCASTASRQATLALLLGQQCGSAHSI